MSGFVLSTQQREFVRWVREVAESQLLRYAGAGTPGRVNRGLVAAMGEAGLLGRLYGEGDSVGGAARAAAMDLRLLRETLAAVSTEAETALALQGLGSYPILLSGNEAVAERWLPLVVSGEAVAAYALSEPEAGSDAAALELAAVPDGDGWRLSGEKLWISNAPDADVYSLFARTTPEAGARGVTAFVVPGDAEGLSGESLEMVSPHPVGRLVFDGVRVGPADVLGEVDRGFSLAMATLDVFRPSVGAFAVGMAQAALDAAVAHTTTRRAFGGVLADQQAVSHKLADMATRIEASRLLVYTAASASDAGAERGELSRASAMAKLDATETAQFVVDAAVQLVGARALQRGHVLEHLYRDVRAPRIYEGASEVQRTIIGRSLTR
jgi:alkylation response protein AidB-like acyl-CoA dehydrogenase